MKSWYLFSCKHICIWILFGGKNAAELLKFYLLICLFVISFTITELYEQQEVQFVALAISFLKFS